MAWKALHFTNCFSSNAPQVKYIDFVELGRKLARELKAQGAELLIALTHMRVPNDVKLAEEVEEFDIIAGGHDHDIEVRGVCVLQFWQQRCRDAADGGWSEKMPWSFGCNAA